MAVVVIFHAEFCFQALKNFIGTRIHIGIVAADLQQAGPRIDGAQRGGEIERVNQVGSTDITYVPMTKGFLYLTAVMDWRSRYVLSWEVSNTMESLFCIEALERALEQGEPEVFNTDQWTQFSSE